MTRKYIEAAKGTAKLTDTVKKMHFDCSEIAFWAAANGASLGRSKTEAMCSLAPQTCVALNPPTLQ